MERYISMERKVASKAIIYTSDKLNSNIMSTRLSKFLLECIYSNAIEGQTSLVAMIIASMIIYK